MGRNTLNHLRTAPPVNKKWLGSPGVALRGGHDEPKDREIHFGVVGHARFAVSEDVAVAVVPAQAVLPGEHTHGETQIQIARRASRDTDADTRANLRAEALAEVSGTVSKVVADGGLATGPHQGGKCEKGQEAAQHARIVAQPAKRATPTRAAATSTARRGTRR